jgi:hypothetical protein
MISFKNLSLIALLASIMIGYAAGLNLGAKESLNVISENTCEAELLRELASQNIFLHVLAYTVKDKSESLEIQQIAKNIYESHRDLQLNLWIVAKEIGCKLPTLPGDDEIALIEKIRNNNSNNIDDDFLELSTKYRYNMQNIMTQLMQCRPSAGFCQLYNQVAYRELLRAKGLESRLGN